MVPRIAIVLYHYENKLEFPTKDEARAGLKVSYPKLQDILRGEVYKGYSLTPTAAPQQVLTTLGPRHSVYMHCSKTDELPAVQDPVPAANDPVPVPDAAAEREAAHFLDSLRDASGEALAIVRDGDGFVNVTLLCQKAGATYDLCSSHQRVNWHTGEQCKCLDALFYWPLHMQRRILVFRIAQTVAH